MLYFEILLDHHKTIETLCLNRPENSLNIDLRCIKISPKGELGVKIFAEGWRMPQVTIENVDGASVAY